MKQKPFVLWFNQLGIKDVPLVGGKNASLGEMYRKLTPRGIAVPDGFAVTAEAYFYLLEKTGVGKKIREVLKTLNIKSLSSLMSVGERVRALILKTEFPPELEKEILEFYRDLSKKYKTANVDVAVRSSATAEDLPDASFAGQQETYLNIRGKKELLSACRKCFASLFTNRAISYRRDKHFDHFKIGLSIGVEKMVRADKASSGVMFSIDTESGFKDVVLINGAWGLGENIVQGAVNPDEFYILKPLLAKNFKSILSKKLGDKKIKMIYTTDPNQPTKNIATTPIERKSFCLNDKEILQLTRWAMVIEAHYKKPMDMEWAKDGVTGKLYIVQARPETVQSQRNFNVLEEYQLLEKGKPILSGAAVGSKIGIGRARIIRDVKKIREFKKDEVLATDMTNPDWEPIMKIASAIVTNKGGRTCFSGETKILTNKGFLTIKEIVSRYPKEKIETLSINPKTLKLKWKKIIDGFVRKGQLISVEISQTGRMKENSLKLTPDHKVITFKNRQLISREIQELMKKNEYLISTQKIPQQIKVENKLKKLYFHFHPRLAYLLGGIITDGHIYLKGNHSEVQFIQKPTLDKKKFIKKMKNCLKIIFSYSFHVSVKKYSTGKIRGKKVIGQANAYRCYSKKIATLVRECETNLIKALLVADEKFIYNFLAGVIDGDGTYSQKNNRINIFCSNNELLQALTIACLRLDIAFSTTKNRSIYNIQIVDKIESIFQYTARVKGKYRRFKFGVKLFSAKQLLKDIKERVNYKGRILPYIQNNLLIDANKIKNILIPMIKGEFANHELSKIVNSDLKMLRIKFKENFGRNNEVYNITVEDNHNYFVFTDRYTPVLVNNCHAAIVSRELGIPCIVGTGQATQLLKNNQEITVSCAEGEEGYIYKKTLRFRVKKTNLKNFRRPKTKIMMNVGSPDIAFSSSFIPNDGVGLAREEFIINEHIKIHPLALLNFAKIKDKKIKTQIEQITRGYKNKKQFFIDKLAEGVAMIAAAFYPKDVIVRLSDFKSNEYANLIGGRAYEPQEENPMIGWRGASRYYSSEYRPAFDLECKALHKVREVIGLKNVKIMIPFCRTIEEGKKVIKIMAENELHQGKDGLEIYVMCEIPSNVILAPEFAKLFDGFSIGSNDLTQLTLGVDRDSALVSHVYDERNAAVKNLVRTVIEQAKTSKRKIGICGQAPSDFPDFAQFLVECGIDSISLNPDTVIKTTLAILKEEQKMKEKKGNLKKRKK